MVNHLDMLIAFLLIILCSIATYTDLKQGIISNKVVAVGGLIPVILNWINVSLCGEWINYICNCSVVIVLAVLLYALHVWAGGDCKMMILIALAGPTMLYWDMNLSDYTYWYLYAFVFSFGFMYVCVDNIKSFIKDKSKISKNEIVSEIKTGILRYIKAVIYLSALGQIYVLCVYPHIQIPAVLYTTICIFFVFLISKLKFFSYKWVIFAVALVDVIMFIVTGIVTVSLIWFTYAVAFILIFLRAVSNRFNYEEIDTGNIKKGMILSQESSLILQKSRVKGLPELSDETLKSRLTETEAEAIIRWKTSKYGQDSIFIVRKIPFAIFITLGMICYYILGSVYF